MINQLKFLQSQPMKMINRVENSIKSATENDNPVKMINAGGIFLISTQQNDNPVKWLMVL